MNGDSHKRKRDAERVREPQEMQVTLDSWALPEDRLQAVNHKWQGAYSARLIGPSVMSRGSWRLCCAVLLIILYDLVAINIFAWLPEKLLCFWRVKKEHCFAQRGVHPKTKLIIYSPSCHFRSVRLSFFWRMKKARSTTRVCVGSVIN